LGLGLWGRDVRSRFCDVPTPGGLGIYRRVRTTASRRWCARLYDLIGDAVRLLLVLIVRLADF
jgi:hypothetical protein